MKPLLPLVAIILLSSVPIVHANGDGSDRGWDLLIVDKDVKGTNLRDAPSGKIVKTISFQGGKRRMVHASGETDGWFEVNAMGSVGWMHGSVLGTCAVPTEDGDPVLSKAPANDAPAVATLPSFAPLHPTSLQGEWLKVHYPDGKKLGDGWLPEQALAMSEGDWEQCAEAWSRRK
jgi:hypothetical protein